MRLACRPPALDATRRHQPRYIARRIEVAADYLNKFFHPINVLIDVATSPHTDRTPAISRDSCDELFRRDPIFEDRLVNIPHGVNVTRFRPDHLVYDATTDGRFTLLHVGRLVSRKHADVGPRTPATTHCSHTVSPSLCP
jgi:glycosyltransferase involved in cell wall biosynthesis